MLKLTITEKGGETRTMTFDKDEILIGRVQGNDIVLPKGNISKRHSRIATDNGGFVISDLKSTNGTYVNGRKIVDPTVVAAHDKIYIGDFVIVLDDSAASPREHSVSGRRPPPPPPPAGRLSAAQPARRAVEVEEDDGMPSGPARITRSQPRIPAPPPPPPPPRKPSEANADSVFGAGGDDLAPPAPSDLAGMDDAIDGPVSGARAPVHPLDEGMNSVPTANRPAAALVDAADVPTPPPVTPPPAERPTQFAPIAVSAAVPAAAAAAPSSAFASALGASASSASPISLAAPAAAALDHSAPHAAEAADAAALLDSLIDDPSVTSITVTPGMLLVGRGGREESIRASFGNRAQLIDTLRRVAEGAVPPPAPDQPLVDVSLTDGTRVTLILPPLTATDVMAVIRKPRLPARSFGDLVASGAASRELEQVVSAVSSARLNVLVTGDAEAVGEVVSAIAASLPPESRVVGVGANAPGLPGSWVNPPSEQELPGVLRAATAFRPEHLVVPSVSAGSIPELLLAAAAGQEGLVLGLQARSAMDGLLAVEAMAVRAMGPHGVRELLLHAVDVVIHAASMPGVGMRVVDVSELKVAVDGKLSLDTVVAWRSETGGKTTGKFQVSGLSSRLAGVITGRGGSLPSALRR